jgi:hypothetical protein
MAGSDTARTPSATGWPEQMITQAEAFALAANWPVGAEDCFTEAGDRIPGDIRLVCVKCGQSTGQLARSFVAYNGSLDEMLSMVLRHMVMAHDVPLAGLRANEAKADTNPHGT